MARVVAIFDDLLLGSNVLGMLQAAGHDAQLASRPEDARTQDAAVVVVDLGSQGFDGIAFVEGLREIRPRPPRTLGVYSHVDQETRARAEAAGFDLVVPRSRMAREGAQLVERLASDA